MKISNETKIGAMTAIAITFLILGYNYMANEGDMFKPKSYYVAVYDRTPGIRKGQSVLLNGYKVGYINSLERDLAKNKIAVTLKIIEPLDIPVNSTAQIISEDIMGSKAIMLVLNNKEERFLKSGDTLISDIEKSMIDEISSSIDPVAIKVNEIVHYLDSVLVTSGQLQATIAKTSDVLNSVQKLTDNTSSLIASNHSNITGTMKNIKELTEELTAQKESLANTIKHLESISGDIDNSEIITNLNQTLTHFESIAKKLDAGEGTAGKLINDESLYIELNNAVKDLDRLLKDINNYPEKYVPMPWGKSQRNKAKKASSNEDYNK